MIRKRYINSPLEIETPIVRQRQNIFSPNYVDPLYAQYQLPHISYTLNPHHPSFHHGKGLRFRSTTGICPEGFVNGPHNMCYPAEYPQEQGAWTFYTSETIRH